ncbi:CubicO group peptidase, beta-lactamase class C family [Nannocystis exedens]|uniref:CubicO group peptidase, beta-lactamase class C family n=1 Tax=Nannocystis exedens TaxID=54 RepID=A0A1I1WIN8_9BACT|nr:serine hydrolase domain-containing protein [Nannocystis exedens]PCC67747.1 D-alanyl-D-alanine-carboxypeptidase/endopeptidase AmpH precursor [Nannocystis exedens]SFD94841.1 CubicO group peptidase, beta-lactamase class C family [Nannocystis exedens]
MRRCIAQLPFIVALGLGCAHGPRPAFTPGAALVPAESPRSGVTLAVREVPPAVFSDVKRSQKVAAVLPKLHDVAAKIVADDRLIGLAVGVVVDGELVWGEGFGVRHVDEGGPIDVHTAFRIGSITKVFSGMTALRLADEGLLDLDAPAALVLPELNHLVYPNADARPLTVRDILTHTAGLPRDPDLPITGKPHTREEVMQAIDGLSLLRPPGIGSEYSNLGFVLLGHIIAAAGGKPFGVTIRDSILQPLGMQETVWEATELPAEQRTRGHVAVDGKIVATTAGRHSALSAAGGLWSTVADLARFVAFQLDAWPPRGDADVGPIARSTLREAQRLRALRSFRARTTGDEAAAAGVEGGASGVGFPWSVGHNCEASYVVGHNGALEGYFATIRMFPYAGVGIIVLGNAGWTDTDGIAVQLQRVLADGGVLATRAPQPLPELTEAAQRIVGLMPAWDPAKFGEWSTHAWTAPGNAKLLTAEMQWLHAGLGACTLGALKRASSPWSGVYRAKCEHGDAELTVHLTSAETPKIASFSLGWLSGQPAPELQALAEAAAPMLAQFDEATFLAHFSPGFRRSALTRTIDDVQFEHGACQLDKPLEVRGPREATYALKCDKGTAKLSIAVDRGQPARIVSFQVASTGALPVCR